MRSSSIYTYILISLITAMSCYISTVLAKDGSTNLNRSDKQITFEKSLSLLDSNIERNKIEITNAQENQAKEREIVRKNQALKLLELEREVLIKDAASSVEYFGCEVISPHTRIVADKSISCASDKKFQELRNGKKPTPQYKNIYTLYLAETLTDNDVVDIYQGDYITFKLTTRGFAFDTFSSALFTAIEPQVTIGNKVINAQVKSDELPEIKLQRLSPISATRIVRKASQNMNKDLCGLNKTQVVIQFSAMSTGEITSDAKVIVSSGIDACDQAVRRAILMSQPLPVGEQNGLMSVTFNFNHMKL